MKKMNTTLFNEPINLKLKLIIIVCVVLLWCLVYYLNEWLFTSFVFIQDAISWVFLPAAVRLFAVLLAGWVGVFGLFLGSIVTSILASDYDPTVSHMLVFASISSMAPMLALLLCAWGLKIDNNLQGFSASNLLVLCATSALLSVFSHNFAFYYFGHIVNISDGLGPMFTGDFLGMLIVLYLVRLILPKKAKLHNHVVS